MAKLTDSDYQLIEQLYRDGATDRAVAKALGVSARTVANWKNKDTRFSEAEKAGKRPVNAEVEGNLIKLCRGMTTRKKVTTTNGAGEVIKIQVTEEQHKPDTNAIRLFLCSRMKEVYGNFNNEKSLTEADQDEIKQFFALLSGEYNYQRENTN
jgi:transposase-like protein